MKKGQLIAPRNVAREVLPGVDMQRLLDSGSWVIVNLPKKPTRHSIAQRDYMQRRFAAGYKKLEILLPEHVYSFLQSRLRDGESMAELVERLILSTGDNNQYTYGVEDE